MSHSTSQTLTQRDMTEAPETEKVVFEMPIYSFQIDANAHVNNAVYVQWMEIGQQKFFAEAGLPVSTLREQGVVPVVADTQISYKRPLVLGDEVRIEIWLSELKQIYAWAEFRFYNAVGELAATGRQRGTFVDVQTKRVCKLSPEQYKAMLKFLAK